MKSGNDQMTKYVIIFNHSWIRSVCDMVTVKIKPSYCEASGYRQKLSNTLEKNIKNNLQFKVNRFQLAT